ncbi:MAG: type IV toxin-antitoxin system AbiEi family antitoxin domain-containing protein [Solirubrobacteraceae bacterium]
MRPTDRIIAELAARSHGVVTRKGLEEAGVTPDEIKARVHRGALLRVHHGVYRVGHRAPSAAAVYLAAVLACGNGALLAGKTAGWWLGLVDGDPPPPEVVARTERRVPGVQVVRCRALGSEDGWVHRGVPVTTPARTLVDLAAVLPLDALSTAAHKAGIGYRTTPAQVSMELAKRPTARGRRNLEIVIGRRAYVTLSKLERRFITRLREAGLKGPDETNRPAGGRRVDCRWYVPPLTVELDSFTFHNSRHSWEQDRRREREAYARGDDIRRYTYGDVFEDPRAMLSELRRLLAKRPA